MAFVAEDGTGIASANSLCTVEFADAYFADRGIVAWTGATSVKESALIRATDYIETRFGNRFKGRRQFRDADVLLQVLSWPRECIDGVDADEVPTAVCKAASEYALRALTMTLAPDPTVDDSGRAVASKSEKVGPISESVTFATSGGGSNPALFRPYPAADILLAPFLVRSTGVIRS